MHFGGGLEDAFNILMKNKFNVLNTIQELQVLHPDHELSLDENEDL